MDTPEFAIAIMAAGKGTRLKSKRPKVLHEIGGKRGRLHPNQGYRHGERP